MLKSNKIYVMLCYVYNKDSESSYIYFILFVWNPDCYFSVSLRLGSGHCLVV